MDSLRRTLAAAAGAIAPILVAQVASAHPVTVDGSAADWFNRLPNTDNVGIVARDANGAGELIWRDAPNDTRTDLATPEVVADIVAFQATGSPTGVAFLIRRPQGVAFADPPIQIQIAIDTDRLAGSGQEFFAGFGDTKVANGARWERLVQTLFGSGGQAQVIDTAFNQVAMVSAAVGASDIEIFVPWTALGLMAPPTTPLRFTVATFRSQPNDLTIDIGGAMFSNALDCISDYGDPVAAMFPNTYADVQDLIVDDWLDAYFNASGEVVSPVLVERFVSNAPAGSSDEWLQIKNMSGAALSLDGYKLGDEETPDGNEGMYGFPAGTMLAANDTYLVARSATTFQNTLLVLPDAEIPPSATNPMVPDMVQFNPWAPSAAPGIQLANAGDEILILDGTNTIVDVVVFGNGAYPGITAVGAPPALGVTARNAAGNDTDNCLVDFSGLGSQCATALQCGGGSCSDCLDFACGFKAAGTPCPDANVCNGTEVCNGSGMCSPAVGPACDDMNPCTTDTCDAAMGCANTPVPSGTSCSDNDVCNGVEMCNATGMCLAGMPLDCPDMGPCVVGTCDPVAGCGTMTLPAGATCSDGDVCNGTETCDATGACLAGMPPSCDDGNPCTDETCDPTNGCASADATAGTPCSDGDACNGDEVCDGAGTCMAGMEAACDDANPCTIDSCDAANGCMNVPAEEGSDCSDDDQCNGTETCDANATCIPGMPANCDDSNECTVDSCDSGFGCHNENREDGTPCGDAACAGACQGSTCMCDAGTGGSGAGGNSDGGEGGGGTGGNLQDGGCGCRVAGSDERRTTAPLWSVIALGAIVTIARRQRRRA